MMGCVVGFLLCDDLHYADTSSEPACCDGSDEAAGVCEDTCAAVGELYRQKQETARKLRKTVRIAV
jgi:hypothetical protein